MKLRMIPVSDEVIEKMRQINPGFVRHVIAKGTYAQYGIDEDVVTKFLYTADFPDPDLILRTSGEERVSNFLLWQLAYSELYFTDVYWPGFRKVDFLRAIRSYQMRQRRFGK
jgi:tritrans,polycis-undecaprenyl-diphosphate synthase [geranylgeranyl-diphosphate specific]